ncbi:MAG: DMT family transporter [Desulfobacterales bacterium]|nr:DMT family transporter [Desulfobacterales bacterium]
MNDIRHAQLNSTRPAERRDAPTGSWPISRSGRWTGTGLMLASAFLFSVVDGLIKLSGPGFRVWDIAFYRFGLGLVILMGIMGWKQNPFKTSNLKLMIIRGLTGTTAFLLLVIAIRHIPISTAMVLFFTFPAFAALFSFLLFGEKISFGQIGCVLGALIGAAILFDYQLSDSLWGQAAGLTSGMFAGVTVCLIKKLRETNGSTVIYLYFCLIGAVITFPAFISDPHLPTSAIEWLMIGGIVFSALAAQLLMNQGFQYCKSWEGGLILTSEVIFTSLLGIILLGEIFSWRFGCGGFLIVFSAVFSNFAKDRTVSVYAGNSSQRLSHP